MADITAVFANLSSTESSNAPTGATAVGTGLDDNIRMQSAHLAGARDACGWFGLKLTTVTGTNTVAASVAAQGSITMAPTAYATGQRFHFIPAATNTGATTLNVNGLGAKNVFFGGRACIGGELKINQPVVVEYDGTQMQVLGSLDINTLTEDTSPDISSDYVETYDASATGPKKVKLQNISGITKLNSGTVTSATSLDIVMTSYTAFRNKLLVFDLLPATDAVTLALRFSTDGGSTYDTGSSDYSYGRKVHTNLNVDSSDGADANSIQIQSSIGNASGEGIAGRIEILHTVSTTLWTKAIFHCASINSAASVDLVHSAGSGVRRAAQDTDAIRLIFSSGNIASGNWALYGYN